ncbi:HTH-10 family transcription regulator [Natrialba magadii ATCC 43099]|uniref:Bacterio-opsin activator HTH domain-containing protein n=1 Tax=Natrialba magadii (strain ATCC 43099 / DSM 3394 / CCM 3739 / CIP 104546 / IAM 13178 / JCM 8861 / NBRC 102185 / NCIMB 2190 / MS3) TaxID=547559 RepID=D3SZ85_NATMM|nr:helix-turn-helix domain-containing protein [Natrialba magadii]ADD04219.1 HTH-10 family transcription regulator [Natrialba magadii ATCC 43099]ELY26623.1 bacterio-opsin activator HTH domain-containing protein [Natrialba magadii ATCC 43099]
MSVIATIAVPATAFPLGSVLDSAGAHDTTVSIETTIPTSEGVLPYLWVPADIAPSIITTLESRSMVAGVSIIDEFDDTVLVEIEWATSVNGILKSIQESDVLVTNATGTAEQWTFRLRFPSYDSLSTFYTACVDREIPIELLQLHEAVSAGDDQRFGLTTAQRELIVAAYEAGYFDIPRETTLVELGHELGISDSAVSQRLRRGLSTLIGSTLAIDPHHTQGEDSGRSSTSAPSRGSSVGGGGERSVSENSGEDGRTAKERGNESERPSRKGAEGRDEYEYEYEHEPGCEYEYNDESTSTVEDDDADTADEPDTTASDAADENDGPELQTDGSNES